jgi:hypothetical protein
MSGPHEISEDENSPKCVAINVCDRVILDALTQNKTLVGCFNAIGSGTIPFTHPQMFVMVSLWGVRRKTVISVSIRDPEMFSLFSQDVDVDLDDPLVVFDCVFDVRGLPITQAGTYFVDVRCNSKLLAERRFSVLKME